MLRDGLLRRKDLVEIIEEEEVIVRYLIGGTISGWVNIHFYVTFFMITTAMFFFFSVS